MPEYRAYVGSVGVALPDILNDALEKYKNAKTHDEKKYFQGYVSGLHMIVSLMHQMGKANDIPLSDLGIDEKLHERFLI